MTANTEVLAGAIDGVLVAMKDQNERLRSIEAWKEPADLTIFELAEQVQILTGQVRRLEEAQKDTEADHYVELRRIIKVIAYTEGLSESGFIEPEMEHLTEAAWDAIARRIYRRYSHLQVDGKPLWSKPPALPRPQTKALITEALKRRQEA